MPLLMRSAVSVSCLSDVMCFLVSAPVSPLQLSCAWHVMQRPAGITFVQRAELLRKAKQWSRCKQGCTCGPSPFAARNSPHR